MSACVCAYVLVSVCVCMLVSVCVYVCWSVRVCVCVSMLVCVFISDNQTTGWGRLKKLFMSVVATGFTILVFYSLFC